MKLNSFSIATLSLMVTMASLMALSGSAVAQDDKAAPALQFKMKTLDGKEISLQEKYLGKVVLFVNVASQCGLTPQYEQLQALHEKYSDQGLAVVGVPCNQFGNQEPGSAKEIQSFCQDNYGVKFDMLSKVEVNGEGACDLYKYLTGVETKPAGKGKISWNFEKFILDRKGNVIARLKPGVTPDDPAVIETIEKALADK